LLTRSSLIPNLSYVSEAAAYVLDCQLRTRMVPYTDIVQLSSKSFHYPFWDRHGISRKKKPLPPKTGSFQVFLKGYEDANKFLRDHPWPDQYLSGIRTLDGLGMKRRRGWADSCRPSRARGEDDGESDGSENSANAPPPGPDNFVWTDGLKQSFREELEKLVVLDYIMRNTDRGLDNWMVKVDWENQQASLVSEPPSLGCAEAADDEPAPRPVDLTETNGHGARRPRPYATQKPMDATTPPGTRPDPNISIGAIDNSLSWPWKHPDAWRRWVYRFLPSLPVEKYHS